MLPACSSCPGSPRSFWHRLLRLYTPSARGPRQMDTLHEYAVVDPIEGSKVGTCASAQSSSHGLYFQRNWAFPMSWHGIPGQSQQVWGVNACKLPSKPSGA
jgi:hypothetical protein